MDHIVGELMKTLEQHDLAKNTLVIFSSDNGPEVPTTMPCDAITNTMGLVAWCEARSMGRRPSRAVHCPLARPPRRSHGRSNYLPDRPFATAAAITDFKLPNNAGEDSFNLLPALLGGREPCVYTCTKPSALRWPSAMAIGSISIIRARRQQHHRSGSGA